MQDRYAGDVGDFGKIGLLRQIANAGLTIGVNWYHTYKPEEHNNDDGKHLGYLDDNSFEDCDNVLRNSLRKIVVNRRSIAVLEKARLIPDANYYSVIIRPGNEQSFSREHWHREAIKTLSESDIVFCDPDNGLLVKSVSLSSSKSDKYVTENEIVDYYLTGKSVVFYNHRCREKESVYLKRFVPLQMRDELSTAKWIGLKFTRGTVRDYFFIIQPDHYEKIYKIVEKMMNSNWNRHFKKLDLHI
jgi:hypothetical protein